MNDGNQVYLHTQFRSGSIFTVSRILANKMQLQLKKRNLEFRSTIHLYIPKPKGWDRSSDPKFRGFLTYIIW